MTMFDQTVIAYNYASTANDGKIVSQTTTPSGGAAETVNYTYDSLGRLSQAATAGAGGWGMSWMYDGWGNRLQQSAVKGTVPTITTTTDPATNRIAAHTYDANGNTTYTPLQGTMTYDALNRLATVASDTYGYDAGNKRIWKNTEFTFWGARGERIGRYSAVKLVDDASQHVFVFQKVAVDEYFGGRRLTTQDRLGSVGGYYPYGEAKSGTVSNADSFATYYRESSGLDYGDQRHYGSVYGRFITADASSGDGTVGGDKWNKYAYTQGDPINYSDPGGLARCRPVGWSHFMVPTILQELTEVTIHCESEGGSLFEPRTVTLGGYVGFGELMALSFDLETQMGYLDQIEWDNTLGQLNAARLGILVS